MTRHREQSSNTRSEYCANKTFLGPDSDYEYKKKGIRQTLKKVEHTVKKVGQKCRRIFRGKKQEPMSFGNPNHVYETECEMTDEPVAVGYDEPSTQHCELDTHNDLLHGNGPYSDYMMDRADDMHRPDQNLTPKTASLDVFPTPETEKVQSDFDLAQLNDSFAKEEQFSEYILDQPYDRSVTPKAAAVDVFPTPETEKVQSDIALINDSLDKNGPYSNYEMDRQNVTPGAAAHGEMKTPQNVHSDLALINDSLDKEEQFSEYILDRPHDQSTPKKVEDRQHLGDVAALHHDSIEAQKQTGNDADDEASDEFDEWISAIGTSPNGSHHWQKTGDCEARLRKLRARAETCGDARLRQELLEWVDAQRRSEAARMERVRAEYAREAYRQQGVWRGELAQVPESIATWRLDLLVDPVDGKRPRGQYIFFSHMGYIPQLDRLHGDHYMGYVGSEAEAENSFHFVHSRQPVLYHSIPAARRGGHMPVNARLRLAHPAPQDYDYAWKMCSTPVQQLIYDAVDVDESRQVDYHLHTEYKPAGVAFEFTCYDEIIDDYKGPMRADFAKYLKSYKCYPLTNAPLRIQKYAGSGR